MQYVQGIIRTIGFTCVILFVFSVLNIPMVEADVVEFLLFNSAQSLLGVSTLSFLRARIYIGTSCRTKRGFSSRPSHLPVLSHFGVMSPVKTGLSFRPFAVYLLKEEYSTGMTFASSASFRHYILCKQRLVVPICRVRLFWAFF